MTSQQEQPLAAFTMISRPRWLWLVIISLAVVAILIYGFLGAVPRTVRGMGLTRYHLDLYTVAAPQGGIVEKILVEVGSEISQGTPIITLTADVFEVELDSARARLALLKEEDERLSASAEATLADSQRRLESSIRESEESIRSSTELLAARERLLKDQEKLLEQGFLAKETVLATQTTVASLRSSVDSAKTSIVAAQLEATQSQATLKQARSARREAIQQAASEIQKLEKQQLSDYTIRSVVSGTVIEISSSAGDPVSAGQKMVAVEPFDPFPDGRVDVVAFLPQRTAKELEAGDAVQVSPSFASRSRYGFIKGTLSHIDVYAATDGELGKYIESTSMIDQVQELYKSVLVGRIELERSKSTESGFDWSTSKGWPGKIGPGTILDVQVIYKVDRPIDLLLPWLRSLIGE